MRIDLKYQNFGLSCVSSGFSSTWVCVGSFFVHASIHLLNRLENEDGTSDDTIKMEPKYRVSTANQGG